MMSLFTSIHACYFGNKKVRSEVKAVVDSLRLDIDEDLQVVEKKLEDFSKQITNQSTRNIDCNLVIRNLPERTNENIQSKVSALFREGLKVQIIPINCERKQSRSTHTSGVVIVSCKSKAVVNDVMSAKYKLKSSRQYSDVFIHRDQTVQQRIECKNFQTIVDVLKSVDPNINMKGAEVIASRYVNSRRSSENRSEQESRGTSQTQRRHDVERTIQHEVTLPTYTITTTQEQVIGNRTTNTAVETTINSREMVDGSYLQVFGM